MSRDFMRSGQTPMLIMPDDMPAHPYAVCMEVAELAPKAEVTLYPWKEPKDLIPRAVRHWATSSGRNNPCHPPAETGGEAPIDGALVPTALEDGAHDGLAEACTAVRGVGKGSAQSSGRRCYALS